MFLIMECSPSINFYAAFWTSRLKELITLKKEIRGIISSFHGSKTIHKKVLPISEPECFIEGKKC